MPVLHRFTVEQYHEMARARILKASDRVELIRGEIVCMSPIGRAHGACVNRLTRILTESLGRRATIAVQNSIVLGDDSEPQPDIAVLRFREDGYVPALPGPADDLAVIEVSDSTAEDDSRVKMPLYGSEGIREALLVDLQDDCIEVHRRPTKAGYRNVRRVGRGQRLALLAFPDLSPSVDDILGDR